MTEKPILFSGPMIRAILEGRKTQTRRVIDFSRVSSRVGPFCCGPDGYDTVADKLIERVPWTANRIMQMLKCPYGGPGDRLWVRETWGCDPNDWAGGPEYCKPLIVYKASWPDEYITVNHCKGTEYPASGEYHWGWHPSIFMPRWASRITLEVEQVRVQRVQEISEDDALAEGIDQCNSSVGWIVRERFQRLWDTINGTHPGRSWSDNPWVWCVSFRRLAGQEG